MLHELAAALLFGAGVERPPLRKRTIDDPEAVPRALRQVLDRIAPDYIPLLRGLQDGLSEDPVVAEVGRALLRALLERDLLELRTEGVSLSDLERAVKIVRSSITRIELIACVTEITRQENRGKALAFDPVAEQLTVDRRLLFMIVHGRATVRSQLNAGGP